MRGLIKYLSPFAPDQSGAAGVFYDLGGIIVICDAGGCTGNICGFDEPRWFRQKSAIFSAGLRDMDAILGRDDQLVGKLADAAKRLEAPFAVLIGTPVPAVIATDFRALKRMAEKRCRIPVLTVPCTGTRLYDEGEEEAYLALFRAFSGSMDGAEEEEKGKGFRKEGPVPGRIGVLGATPLNFSSADPAERVRHAYGNSGQILCYGTTGGLAAVQAAPTAEKNLVTAPSAIKAAAWLKEQYGTPYELWYPAGEEAGEDAFRALAGRRVLVIHQQVLACALRERLAGYGCTDVTVASFFMMKEELMQPQDVRLSTEESLAELILGGGYDAVAADRFLARAARGYKGTWIHVPHYAVSGECRDV